MTKIGLIGSGNIGSAVARQAVSHGYDVVLSNSRGPETLGDLVAELGEHARAATAAEAAAAGDLVVVTIPFRNVGDLPVEPLAGKVVIDTNNYYFERDGHVADIDEGRTTVSEVLADHLGTARVVKAFNVIRAGEIVSTATPAGTPGRRALPIAGDDADAKQAVTAFIDAIGFDVVDAGPLAEGWRFDRDQPAYGPRLDADQLREALARATR